MLTLRMYVTWLSIIVASFLSFTLLAANSKNSGSTPVPKIVGWAPTTSMNAARMSFTATLLANGNVLVAGGGSSDELNSAELYTPSTKTWTDTGSMSTPRDRHTATLLPNGKVLVAGGVDGGIALASAELYDTSSGTWAATGSMNATHYYHTATLLPNGRVLVTGGDNAFAEIYNPNTGTWSFTTSMSTSRVVHTATLLSNGKVLVTGGGGSSAELYDPNTGWNSAGSMSAARSYHTATLLSNGKVLVAGGVASNYLASAELYDPSTNAWSATASMAVARSGHTATLLASGKVLVAGGYSGSSIYRNSAEIYDPNTATWGTSYMRDARAHHTATLLGSEVLIAGGMNSNYLSAAELYNMGNPLVTSNPATSITTTSAILNGQIDDNGTSTTGTFDFGTTNSYGASIATIPGTITPGSGSTAVTATKTGLICNTSYHYRVTVVSIYGTSYGSDQSFTTAACPTAPLATTKPPANITATSGSMNGTVTPRGANTTVTFDFGLTTSYGTNIAATPSPLSAGNTSSSVTANRSGLTCNTSYHYRVKAVSSAGTTYGDDQNLTTAACGNGSCGDVNQDGTVTMADALAVARHVTGLAVSGTCFAQ